MEEKKELQEVEPEVKHNPFHLEDECVKLLLSEPFFAALSRRIDKSECKHIPTAGVRVNPNSANFELLYNPDFFAPLTESERQDVLKHEYYHLIFEHVTGRLPGDHKEPGKNILWNYATDLAINSHLNNLPKGSMEPGKDQFKDYPPGKHAEWYYEKFKQDKNFEIKIINISFSSAGDHSKWENENKEAIDELGRELGEMAKEKLKDILRKAVNECGASASWGSVSADTRKDIVDRLTSRVDWKKVLRYFVKTSQRASKNNSIKKINKRYPYIYAGKKTVRQANIAISIDQSGSVGDELLATFFTELDKLAEIASFTVIPFDHEVSEKEIFVWKKGETKKWVRVLCGGTNFDAPTRYVNKQSKFDGHMILTDLCAPKPIPSKCQRIWMTNKENADRPYFQTNELVVAIETSKKG
ncbi:MAG: VWA-like domain-containing protein [Nanoarchaeota archaeon]|nr:VWA-like domain-containing protein [Nanoarchaeota archaeon]